MSTLPDEDLMIVRLEDVEIDLSIGIMAWEHERRQKIRVSVEMISRHKAAWSSIADCLDYARVHDFLMQRWAGRGHVDLVETLCEELVAFVFEEPRVEACRVRIRKPEVFPGTATPSVEFIRRRPR
ncbi:MAG: dihydroneopterin aldolase [Alphaproteobacteria bacterium]|nr:dihydroneopterin aldolase [Alphaproteobacteria bacterium]